MDNFYHKQKFQNLEIIQKFELPVPVILDLMKID